jgi:peptidoglycan/xylan/chitin deacetylase (PgdA/CDA1 family)
MTILCYHSIDPTWSSPLAVRPAAFAEHCAWLAGHRRVLPLTEAVRAIDERGHLPRGCVALTFDDGFEGVFEYAFPVLARLRLPATVFLVAGTLASDPQAVDWVDSPPPVPLKTLTRDQVAEMAAAGFAFGSHGYRHRDLTALSDEECEEDLRRSRELLSDVLHAPLPYLAYPRGRHDGRVRREAERAGFTHAFSLPETREAAGPLSIPRVGVYPGNTLPALRVKTAPLYLRFRTSGAYPLARRLLDRTELAGSRESGRTEEAGDRMR